MLLELDYYKENEDEYSARRVEPYALINGREGWYVATFDPAKAEMSPLPPRPHPARRAHRGALQRRAPTSTRRPTSTAGRAPARSAASRTARVWISPERARWAREQRKVVGEWDDGSIAVELSFAGVDWLVREVLKEAGDAAVLEPAGRARAARAAPAGRSGSR